MTGRFVAGGAVFKLGLASASAAAVAVAVASAAACGNGDDSSEKTGSSGVADPADGCILADDAGQNAYPAASELPSGACDDTAKSCESVVAVACGGCGMTSLALGRCGCVSGSWSCTVDDSASACPVCLDAGDE